jgi:hypothetical protein
MFDTDKFTHTMDKINALYAEADVLLKGLLEEINPEWQEQAEERKAAKVAQKAARKAKPEPIKEIVEMAKSNMVDSDVMEVLKTAWCEGLKLYLPPAQMERKLYERTNEVLIRIGGKWKGGKTRAHVFDDDPAPLLAEVLGTGIMPLDNPLDFFATPQPVIDIAAEKIRSHFEPRNDVVYALEPSAGDGALVKALRKISTMFSIDAYEVDEKRAQKLQAIGDKDMSVYRKDFLSVERGHLYDLVFMNPPFTSPADKKAYIAHVQLAHDFLMTGGLLIAICPSGLKYNSDKRTAAFREFILSSGTIEDLPSGAFGESGTMVSTVLVSMGK